MSRKFTVKICILANSPGLTVMVLVLGALLPSVKSFAVNVRLGGLAVRNVTLKVLVPETSAAFDGGARIRLDSVP